MKRNFVTAIAVMVTAIFVGTTIAQASDISFSGQIRPRMEIADINDFNDQTDINTAFATRVRFNVKAKANPDTSAFLQFQSVGLWGGAGTATSNRTATGGGGAEANDQLNDVGLHQAYFTVNNFAGLPVLVKVGRQEIVLDGHRLIGNTGWTPGAQTHDAILALHSADNHTLAYAYSKGAESSAWGGTMVSADSGANAGDTNDVNSHVFWGNLQGINSGDLSVYYIFLDNDSSLSGQGGDLQTVGLRQKGKLMGLDYRAEGYYQYGEGGAYSSGSAFQAAYSQHQDVSTNAYMFGLRLGKTYKSVQWTPTVTLWYDHLSGTDDDDIHEQTWGTFHTLFDTGHKFYGFMDHYLSATGAGSGNMGLQDLALKVKLKPRDKWTLKADLHHFMTAVSPASKTLIIANTNLSNNSTNDLGQELDLTLAHGYNANTKIVFGYSHYWATQTFGDVNGRAATTGSDDGNWAYLMMDVKF